MLEKVDLTLALDKRTYKQALPGLRQRLRAGQNLALQHKIPVIVVFEGWDAAGKGSSISLLTKTLDPRHFKVNPVVSLTSEEALRPFLWRFWRQLPPDGEIAIFDRSWYSRVLVERVDKLIPRKDWQRAYDEIDQFERQLADDGALIVKFWLHISKGEQSRRLRKLAATPALSWMVTKDEWRQHRKYSEYELAIEEMLVRTSTDWGPWTIVEAENRRFAGAKIHETITQVIEKSADQITRAQIASGGGHGRRKSAASESPASNTDPVGAGAVAVSDGSPHQSTKTPEASLIRRSTVLEKVDLSKSLPKNNYRKTLRRLQARLRQLHHDIFKEQITVLIIYEGWDAAGKGGNIKRLTQFLDPRGYKVTSYAAPTEEERRHHYLWRFWRDLPRPGQIGVFDRSWYGRVLVERAERLCSDAEWRRSYQEINEFEGQLVSAGVVLVKFWLQISQEEQLRRFQSRAQDQFRHWKLTPEDWRNREKFPQYEDAVLDMLEKTSSDWASWTIVEANDKRYARVKTLKALIDAVERTLA